MKNKNSKLTSFKLIQKKYANWLKNKDLSINTIDNYVQAVNRFGNKLLTTTNLRNYVKKNLKKYAPSTLTTRIRALTKYTQYQKANIKWEKITRLLPKYQQRLFPTIDKNDVELLKRTRYEVNDWIHERNNLIIDFLTYTGVRVSELVNIKHSDYQNQQIKIHGKGNKVRFVCIPPFLVKYLNNSDNYLFTNAKGQPLTRIFIAKIIQTRTRQAKINKVVSPHTFRRSFATRLNNKKAKLATIQKLLGHASLDTTMTYIHNDFDTLYKDYSKLWQ